MPSFLHWAYRAAGELASLAALLAPPGEGKLVRTLNGRRGVAARLADWGRRGRDPARPLLWMHAPSVGEGLQARPVLELMRARRPDVQLAYTFYSPSAERFARALDVDVADYLPFDTVRAAHATLDALRPTALVYAKLDVWPLLTAEAHRRGVALGLVSATVSPGSGRQRGAARTLLHDAYAALDAVGTIAAEDAGRLRSLGVRAEVLRDTGDTRYDQVAARAAAVDRASPLLAPLASDRPTLVAGSSWPADEAVLLPAWEALRGTVPSARLIIAPHEPTPAHLAPLEAWARAHGITLARLGTPEASSSEVVLVDRVGVLGDLYALATAAFVGGGFHAAGLHSVLEPAAFGAPVLFGPRFSNARDADLLRQCGGGASVADRRETTAQLQRWLGDAAQRATAGRAARALVAGGVGAAERSFALVEGLLRGG